mmetsp:Transcript_34369/g.84589  ORF Transcript_34369/g.84589 Transcript_34369/m.84589 type:complete len:656 (+) Transcript_34369:55-2022(+)|eukprot:CAMPEP_0206232552 /NCGR_PEP_ID=MMETSP0047_2-20121206/11477_1 /ASSEMBLY_ACC=CAM_ASM_000192 /TAXON_ID=195065 /ORGANISM="Chroomonas mesostigmatica_cf, Strain CCMP1168" /LENGTH=655 /DNA_ID=CAMNT_0053656297 /DNA_START=195 /DNA_END=2162 /DNA_ORIENTATION=+
MRLWAPRASLSGEAKAHLGTSLIPVAHWLAVATLLGCLSGSLAFSTPGGAAAGRHLHLQPVGSSSIGGVLLGRRGLKTRVFTRIGPALARGCSLKGGNLRGGGPASLRMSASAASPRLTATLDTLKFDNSFVRELPSDQISEYDKVKGNMPRQVQKACYSLVLPTEVKAPKLVSFSKECAELFDLPPEECKKQRFADILAGNELFPGSVPMAMCYGGHQFGNWAGQLGDGRAMSLGEVVNSKGERWELQLKGAGPTPYSRTADGRAVLRSSVREFLCSEAMFHLGVPTTRALSLVLTGDMVVRDMFYNGNAAPEKGAVVCRVAPSFIRFGNFEIFASRGDKETLVKLLDFTLNRDFPEIAKDKSGADAYVAMLKEVCRTTAIMVAHWMRVGFVHGVMNTDNMSILGLTIDYGPYGWVDNYDPEWTPNTTDGQRGRYKFGNQPGVAFWNIVRLANALYPAVGEAEPLQEAISVFEEVLTKELGENNRRKLGLMEWFGDEDEKFAEELMNIMQKQETDMTILYRKLADIPISEGSPSEDEMLSYLEDAFYKPLSVNVRAEWKEWLGKYASRIKEQGGSDMERKKLMNAANPKYVLRNYIAQLAIDKADEGDFSMVDEVLEVMRRPYDEQPEFEEKYFAKRPDWARTKPGCSALSCSS